MAASKRKMWLLWALVALGAGWWASRRYQVFVVKFVGGAAGPIYTRGPSKWFATKQSAMAYAQTQGVQGSAVALVADRNGGLLEGFADTWLTGEALDAIVVNAEQYGLQLDNSAAA